MSDSAAPWTVAHQAPLSMGFSRREYWSGFPSPGDLPDPGIQAGSPALQVVLYQLNHRGSPCVLPYVMFVLRIADALVFLFFFPFFLSIFFTLVDLG